MPTVPYGRGLAWRRNEIQSHRTQTSSNRLCTRHHLGRGQSDTRQQRRPGRRAGAILPRALTHGDADQDANRHFDAQPDPDLHADCDLNAQPYPHFDPDASAYADFDAQPDRDLNAQPYSHSDASALGDFHTNTRLHLSRDIDALTDEHGIPG
ncbi:MAG TPA: hypothetical protein VI876_06295, partial [Dehalococcoidia bacterium]|nr:hypothetical protein [Dehalococcoidia bacterium]